MRPSLVCISNTTPLPFQILLEEAFGIPKDGERAPLPLEYQFFLFTETPGTLHPSRLSICLKGKSFSEVFPFLLNS